MNHEFFQPPYDPEFGSDPENPFSITLGKNSIQVLERIQDRFSVDSRSEVLWEGVNLLHWFTESVQEGRIILGAKPNQEYGEKLVSPVLDAVEAGIPDEDWLRRRMMIHERGLMQGDELQLMFGYPMAHELNKIEERTGVSSYVLLLDTGVRMLDWATEKTSEGGFVIAYDRQEASVSYMTGSIFLPDPSPDVVISGMSSIRKWRPLVLMAA